MEEIMVLQPLCALLPGPHGAQVLDLTSGSTDQRGRLIRERAEDPSCPQGFRGS